MDHIELARLGQIALQKKLGLTNKKKRKQYFKKLGIKSSISKKLKKIASEQNAIGS